MAITTATSVANGFHSPLSTNKSNFSSPHCFLSYMEPYMINDRHLKKKNSGNPFFGPIRLSQPVLFYEQNVNCLYLNANGSEKDVGGCETDASSSFNSESLLASYVKNKRQDEDKVSPCFSKSYKQFKTLLLQLATQSKQAGGVTVCNGPSSVSPCTTAWSEKTKPTETMYVKDVVTNGVPAFTVNTGTSKTISSAEKRAETFLRFLLRLEGKTGSSFQTFLQTPTPSVVDLKEKSDSVLAFNNFVDLEAKQQTLVQRISDLNNCKFGETFSQLDSTSALSKLHSIEGNYSTGISEWSSLDAAHYSSEESEESYTLPLITAEASSLANRSQRRVSNSSFYKNQATSQASKGISFAEMNHFAPHEAKEGSTSMTSPPPARGGGSTTETSQGTVLKRSKGRVSVTGLTSVEQPMPQEAATDHFILRWEAPDAAYVEVAGTFSNPPWQKRFPLKFCPNLRCHWIDIHEATSDDFKDISGRHQFKYIVDGQWMCNSSLVICDDGNHNFNNVVVIVPKALMRQTARRHRRSSTQSVGNTVLPLGGSVETTSSSGSLLPGSYREDKGNLRTAMCYSSEYEDNKSQHVAFSSPPSSSASSVTLPSLSSPTAVPAPPTQKNKRARHSPFIESRGYNKSFSNSSHTAKPLELDRKRLNGKSHEDSLKAEKSMHGGGSVNGGFIATEIMEPLSLTSPTAARNQVGSIKRSAASQDLCKKTFISHAKGQGVTMNGDFPGRVTREASHFETVGSAGDGLLDLASDGREEEDFDYSYSSFPYPTLLPTMSDAAQNKEYTKEVIPSVWTAAFGQRSADVTPSAHPSTKYLSLHENVFKSSTSSGFLPPETLAASSGAITFASSPSSTRLQYHAVASPDTVSNHLDQRISNIETSSFSTQGIQGKSSALPSTYPRGSSPLEESDDAEEVAKHPLSLAGRHDAVYPAPISIDMNTYIVEESSLSSENFMSSRTSSPSYPLTSPGARHRRTVPATRYGPSVHAFNRCNSAYATGRTFDPIRDNLRRVSSMTAGNWPITVTELLHSPESLLNLDVPENIRGTTGLTLYCGGYMIPHPEKLNEGADAYFSASIEGKNSVCVGVADGVGEWESIGLNPRLFAEELMQGCREAFLNFEDEDVTIGQKAMTILQRGYDSTHSFGSSTALIVCLDEKGERIGVSNLGDSTMILLHPQRFDNMSCVYRTKEQQHQFNCPYQLSRLPKPEDYEALKAQGKDLLVRVLQNSTMLPQDTPVLANWCELKVTEGDLIILGTDGVFDNLYDYEICELANLALSPFEGLLVQQPDMITSPRTLATAIAEAALYRSKDMAAKTPFMKHARECGTNYIGGKLDDITVVACWVTRK